MCPHNDEPGRRERTYAELVLLPTFLERFAYLKLDGVVGEETFGFDRYVNQRFYKGSAAWRHVRDEVIVRDNGCDLGVDGHEIRGPIFIHHMNPVRTRDVVEATAYLLDPQFLICVSFNTHNAIHFGNERMLPKPPIVRRRHDTCPWKG